MMSLSNTSDNKRLPSMAILAMLSCLALFPRAATAEPTARFERTYSPRGTAHLTISNVNGTIRISAWEKRTILVRANLAPAVDIDEREAGDNILIAVKRSFRVGRADFEIN